MGNETGCSSRKDFGVVSYSDIISHVGCLSVNMSPSVIHKLLRRNLSRDRLSECKKSTSMVRRLFICNKSCALFKCKKITCMVHRLLGCNTPQRLSE